MAWGHGWTTSRGVAAPVTVDGGWWAEVGQPGHRERHILHTWDADRLAAVAPRPGAWIKVVGAREDLRAALPAPWVIDEDGHLMSTVFAPGVTPAPDGYRIEVNVEGPVAKAVARHTSGDTAAAAYLASGAGFGVVDRVETAPEHRRRGLGTAVMTALTDHAARSGLSTGILIATDQGRHLYEALGWTARAAFAAARVPEA